jgi:hypothetical protein
MLNLLMAACWLILGAMLLVWHWGNPNSSASIRGTGIPLGWFGIAMAFYNLLRWWLNGRYKEKSRLRLGRTESPGQGRPSPAPDPDLNFTSNPSRTA